MTMLSEPSSFASVVHTENDGSTAPEQEQPDCGIELARESVDTDLDMVAELLEAAEQAQAKSKMAKSHLRKIRSKKRSPEIGRAEEDKGGEVDKEDRDQVVVPLQEDGKLGVIWSNEAKPAILVAFADSPSARAGMGNYVGRRITHVNAELVHRTYEAKSCINLYVARALSKSRPSVTFTFADDDAWPESLDLTKASVLRAAAKSHGITQQAWSSVCRDVGVNPAQYGPNEVYEVIKHARDILEQVVPIENKLSSSTKREAPEREDVDDNVHAVAKDTLEDEFWEEFEMHAAEDENLEEIEMLATLMGDIESLNNEIEALDRKVDSTRGEHLDCKVVPNCEEDTPILQCHLIGLYINLKCDQDTRGESDWDYVSISVCEHGLRWTNSAGISWTLDPTPASDTFVVGEDCPYLCSYQCCRFERCNCYTLVGGPLDQLYAKLESSCKHQHRVSREQLNIELHIAIDKSDSTKAEHVRDLIRIFEAQECKSILEARPGYHCPLCRLCWAPGTAPPFGFCTDCPAGTVLQEGMLEAANVLPGQLLTRQAVTPTSDRTICHVSDAVQLLVDEDVCPVCNGNRILLNDPCPLCGDSTGDKREDDDLTAECCLNPELDNRAVTYQEAKKQLLANWSNLQPAQAAIDASHMQRGHVSLTQAARESYDTERALWVREMQTDLSKRTSRIAAEWRDNKEKHEESFAVSAQADTFGADPKLAEEFKGMTLASLKKIGREMGLGEDALDAADFQEDPHDAMIELIVAEQVNQNCSSKAERSDEVLKETRACVRNFNLERQSLQDSAADEWWREVTIRSEVKVPFSYHSILQALCVVVPNMWASPSEVLADPYAMHKLAKVDLSDVARMSFAELAALNGFEEADLGLDESLIQTLCSYPRSEHLVLTHIIPIARWLKAVHEYQKQPSGDAGIVSHHSSGPVTGDAGRVSHHSSGSSGTPQVSDQSNLQNASYTEVCEFVRGLRSKGFRNWVVYKGGAINLNDEEQICLVSEQDLPALVEKAARTDEAEVKQDSFKPPVPLQPWEAEKLQSLASQVISAISDDRYTKDFGEVLLGQLKSWGTQGDAEEWAMREKAWVTSLVDADDPTSREELRKWIENSLVATLREVQKDVNRGMLAGMAASTNSQATGSASANEAAVQAQSSYDAQVFEGSDRLEAESLKQALSESIMEFAEPSEGDDVESQEGLEELEDDFLPYDVGDVEGQDGCSEPETATEDQKAIIQEHASASSTKGSAKAKPCDCCHPCDLSGGCCQCNHRMPRLGLIPALQSWWSEGTLNRKPPSGTLRFYCTACAQRLPYDDCRFPLPFGGCLTQSAQGVGGSQVVEPLSCASCSDTSSDTSWIDVGSNGAWTVVDEPDDADYTWVDLLD